jgi:ketosteroid isomerase-like protein
MSQENVEIVQRDVAARAVRNWSALPKIWHPEIELVLVAGSGVFRGIEEIRRFFDSLSDPYSEYRVEADEIVDAGDCVVTVERVAGRGLKGSDAQTWIHTTLYRVISFKDGKIWRVNEHPSRAEALEAAGQRE